MEHCSIIQSIPSVHSMIQHMITTGFYTRQYEVVSINFLQHKVGWFFSRKCGSRLTKIFWLGFTVITICPLGRMLKWLDEYFLAKTLKMSFLFDINFSYLFSVCFDDIFRFFLFSFAASKSLNEKVTHEYRMNMRRI